MSPTKAERFYGAGSGFGSGGGLGGIDPGVKLLQEELGKLAAQTFNADVNPDRVDGTMSLGTIIALSHAARVVGSGIDPTLGKALDLVDLIKWPLEKIPYAGQVIDLILSPWIVDNVFDTVLAIMRIIPGAGDAADVTKKAVESFEQLLASSAQTLTAALVLARKSIVANPLHGAYLGATAPPIRTTPPPSPVVATSNICASGQYRNASNACVPIPVCPTGQQFNIITKSCAVFQVDDHSAWPKGRAIVPSQWSKIMQYRGKAAFTDLAPVDQQAWISMQSMFASMPFLPDNLRTMIKSYVANGVVAFRLFTGADGAKMGAFYDAGAQQLKIIPLPPVPPAKQGRTSLWGQFTDAVGDGIDYASDKLGDAANATGDFFSDLWDAIGDQVTMVYDTVKKYGCAIVNSDIAVAIAATGAGIIASPAASAAVVSGAAAGRTGCAILEVGELVIAILKLLANGTPQPPPPSPPPEGVLPALFSVVNSRIGIAANVLPSGATPIVLGPPSTKTRAYPTGSIARFNTTRKVWSIYSPLAGALGCSSCLSTPPLGAAAEVNPPVPMGFVKAGEELVPPTGVTQAGAEEDKSSLFKNPYFWLAVGGGVVGAGGVLLIRRRRKAK